MEVGENHEHIMEMGASDRVVCAKEREGSDVTLVHGVCTDEDIQADLALET